jgi:hypothetical protein
MLVARQIPLYGADRTTVFTYFIAIQVSTSSRSTHVKLLCPVRRAFKAQVIENDISI